MYIILRMSKSKFCHISDLEGDDDGGVVADVESSEDYVPPQGPVSEKTPTKDYKSLTQLKLRALCKVSESKAGPQKQNLH